MEIQMTTSDLILMSQTIILGITAAILLWYTVETYKIRKATHIQNTMMAEQLLIMQQNYKFEKEKQISFTDPIFVDVGGHQGENWVARRMTNKGATVKNLSIIPKQNFSAKIEPSNIILSEQTFLIKLEDLSTPVPDKLYFEIHYENQIELKREKTFVYLKAHEKIMESQNH